MSHDMSPRRRTLALALALGALVLVLAACSGGSADDEAVPGGAGDLPGALPENVSFPEPPASALPAPELVAELVDGTPVTGEELWADRPVVLLFTASWCERCAALHREIAAAVDEQGGAVSLLALVPEDDAEAARDYARDLGLGYPVGAAEDRMWLNYAAREPPVVVVVAQGGKVVRGWPGGVEAAVLAEAHGELVERR
jgi:thiol-disulfide isomerase/thioredoxin